MLSHSESRIKELEGKVARLEAVVKALQEVVVDLSDKAGAFFGAAQWDIRTIDLEMETRDDQNTDR